ncbi:putative clathrin assembly protein At4g40080 [Carya illinoinensis]|uniref:ENTH domain-containing protein n=1 Tax=Carya illinoinensis TaxID=32201 RepID=A0A8T1NBN5_CARIL|nr:putative clathrin assembly protein At4g40080 [Carya illinoinensis]KAG6626387.1 hypothetical protein CIPAW_15G044500 [Carya illinoinensis]
MSGLKKLRNLIDILKDKASLIKATLSTSSVNVAVLLATTHDPSSPPSEKRVAAVLTLGNGSRLTACSCIDAIMARLHDTHSAPVAIKCLFTIHNIITRGSFILNDQLSFYPSSGGRNFLNLSTFRDGSGAEMWELSSWVRWYAGLVEQNLMVSKVLGYYFCSSSGTNNDKSKEERFLTFLDSDLSRELDVLVDFAERICEVPDSLHLQRNDLVYEVVRMVSEDYRLVQLEIFLRVSELWDRTENLSDGDLTQMRNSLQRFQDCKERLLLLFANRKRNDRMWDLVSETKMKLITTREKREGLRLVTMAGPRIGESMNQSTRFRKPLMAAESGNLFFFGSGGGALVPLAVSTVG